MAKDIDKAGKQREELQEKFPLPRAGETVIPVKKAEEIRTELKEINESAPKKAAPKKATPKKAEPLTISKPEADLLARKFANVPKEVQLPLDETLAEVKATNDALQKEKKNRGVQSSRIIADLRRTDPPGIKTCGRCSQRVKMSDMDSKKELCEVCAS